MTLMTEAGQALYEKRERTLLSRGGYGRIARPGGEGIDKKVRAKSSNGKTGKTSARNARRTKGKRPAGDEVNCRLTEKECPRGKWGVQKGLGGGDHQEAPLTESPNPNW